MLIRHWKKYNGASNSFVCHGYEHSFLFEEDLSIWQSIPSREGISQAFLPSRKISPANRPSPARAFADVLPRLRKVLSSIVRQLPFIGKQLIKGDKLDPMISEGRHGVSDLINGCPALRANSLPLHDVQVTTRQADSAVFAIFVHVACV